MAFKCPAEGCEDSEKEFQKASALKSHIRNKHPELIEDEGMARSRRTFTGWGLAYRHNEGGQLWSIRHASFETVQGWMYISSPGIITFADPVTYSPVAGRLTLTRRVIYRAAFLSPAN